MVKKQSRNSRSNDGGGYSRGGPARPSRPSRPKKSEGGSDYSGYRSEGGPTISTVTCASCGISCTVPFKPTGGRPVLCNDCFRNSGEGRVAPQRGARERTARPAGESDFLSRQLDLINDKLDRILRAIEE